MHTCSCTRIQLHAHTHLHMLAYTFTRACSRTHTHTRIQARAHAHTRCNFINSIRIKIHKIFGLTDFTCIPKIATEIDTVLTHTYSTGFLGFVFSVRHDLLAVTQHGASLSHSSSKQIFLDENVYRRYIFLKKC